MLDGKDYIYSSSSMIIWTTVECGVSIIATAAATLRPLLQKTKRFALNTPSSGSHPGGSLGRLRPFKLGGDFAASNERQKSSGKAQDQKVIRTGNETRIQVIKQLPIILSHDQDEKDHDGDEKNMDLESEFENASYDEEMVSPCTTSAPWKTESLFELDWEETENQKIYYVEKDGGDMV
jgi:hypothetical protein